MMINGAEVQRWSDTQATRALGRAEAECCAVVRDSRCSQNAVDDDGLGTECTGSCLDGLQRSQGDCVKKRPWEDQTCGIETLVAAGGDQIGKIEHEEDPRRATCGGPFEERKIVARDRCLHQRSRRARASEPGQQMGRTRVEEVAGRIRPSAREESSVNSNSAQDVHREAGKSAEAERQNGAAEAVR